MNERTKLFLLVLIKRVSWVKLMDIFDEMDSMYGNRMPVSPTFQPLIDELVAKLEEE